MNPLTSLAAFVDRTTMYQMVLYATSGLALITIALAFSGVLFVSGFTLLASLATIAIVSFATNFLFAKLFKATSNTESVAITILILFLIIEPAESARAFVELGFIATVAMASKYIIAYRGQHMVNPAAFAGTFAWLTGIGFTTWWVASVEMLLPSVLLGALVVWKLRRWAMVVTFILVGLAFFLLDTFAAGETLVSGVMLYFFSWPTIFLATIMLTEPFTTPPTKPQQVAYGALVATLMCTGFITGLSIPPEAALVIGNVLFWSTTLRQKLMLELIEIRTLAKDTLEFVFKKPAGLRYQAGQYLEWMLPHAEADRRGIRRYFTIASSPTEDVVRLGIRLSDPARHPGSSYKQAIQKLNPGDTVIASQLSGDFMLPKDPDQKIVMIAGGIGMTPFRSHVQYMMDTNDSRDTVLFYCNRTPEDIAYVEELTAARQALDLRVINMISDETTLPTDPDDRVFLPGFITEDTIVEHVPDFKERVFYISGSPGMVGAYTGLLKKLGVSGKNIVLDYFPGLA